LYLYRRSALIFNKSLETVYVRMKHFKLLLLLLVYLL